MYNRVSSVKFKDRWLAAVPSMSESSSSSESRQFSGARSTSADSSASGRRRSLSRSVSSSNERSRPARKKRLRASSSSSESDDATSESEPPRKRLKTKKTSEEIEKEKVYKLRDRVQIIGHPKSELNGLCGLLEYWVIDKKLWIVRGIGNLLKQTLKIKPKYMKKVSAEEAKAAMEKIRESKEKQRLLSALLKTRIRSGLERAKTKDEENMNAKAKKMSYFGISTNGKQASVLKKVSPSSGIKVVWKRPLVEKVSIVRRKEESISRPKLSVVSSTIPPTPFQAFPHYPAPLAAATYIGGICPPPMVPFGMQPTGPPIFNPLPKIEPPSVPTVVPSVTSVPGKGKRPLIPTLPISRPPFKQTETNLEEEIMDQGPDSDEEVANNGPTAPPPKYTNKPNVFRFSSPPFPLGPPPMKPPTAQNTKDAPTLANRTDPITKRKSRFEVKQSGATEPSFQKPPGSLSEQYHLNGGHQKTTVSLSEQRIPNISQPIPSQQTSPARVEPVSLVGNANSVVEERKSPKRQQPNPEQRSKMSFEFKTLQTSRRPKIKMKFQQKKPNNSKSKKAADDKAAAVPVIEKPAIVALEKMPKTENGKAGNEKKTAISDAIRDRILQINAQLRKKQEALQKKKEQESNNHREERKSMSPSRSRERKSKANFSRSRSGKSSSRSISRFRGRRKRRSFSSKARSGSYSSRSRSRSSRSFSRSSSFSSRSRSKRRRRRRRRTRRSSSYSSDSSYY